MAEMTIRKMIKEDTRNLKTGSGIYSFLKIILKNKIKRMVILAEYKGLVAGYVTLMPHAKNGLFSKTGYPEFSDFNVFIQYQNKGIGNELLINCERLAAAISEMVTLGVDLHAGYEPAQRLYVKRG